MPRVLLGYIWLVELSIPALECQWLHSQAASLPKRLSKTLRTPISLTLTLPLLLRSKNASAH